VGKATARTGSADGGELAAARRLLGLDGTATPDHIEQARRSAAAAVEAPLDAPHLQPEADRMRALIDSAAEVLLAHHDSASPLRTPPLPPVPPAEPLSATAAPPDVATEAATAPAPMRRRSAGPGGRRILGYLGIAAALVLVAASGMTLASGGPPPGRSAQLADPHSSPTTGRPAPFSQRLVSGSIGRASEGLDALTAEDALSAFLGAVAAQDVATVRLGLDSESRPAEIAEIFDILGPTPATLVECSATGPDSFVCRSHRPTPRGVELARTPQGWRVRGWAA